MSDLKCPKCGNTRLSYFYGSNQAYCVNCRQYFSIKDLPKIEHQR